MPRISPRVASPTCGHDEACEVFLDTGVNPFTRRKLREGGYTHSKIMDYCEGDDEDIPAMYKRRNMPPLCPIKDEEACALFKKGKREFNPFSGRRINPDGATAKRVWAECKYPASEVGWAEPKKKKQRRQKAAAASDDEGVEVPLPLHRRRPAREAQMQQGFAAALGGLMRQRAANQQSPLHKSKSKSKSPAAAAAASPDIDMLNDNEPPPFNVEDVREEARPIVEKVQKSAEKSVPLEAAILVADSAANAIEQSAVAVAAAREVLKAPSKAGMEATRQLIAASSKSLTDAMQAMKGANVTPAVMKEVVGALAEPPVSEPILPDAEHFIPPPIVFARSKSKSSKQLMPPPPAAIEAVADGERLKDAIFGKAPGETDLYVKDATLSWMGKGLFTNKPIRAGERICQYGGEVLTKAEFKRRYADTGSLAAYAVYISDAYVVDGVNEKFHLGRYANTCRMGKGPSHLNLLDHQDCNARLVPHANGKNSSVSLVATKNIKKGQEIFVAYSATFKIPPPTADQIAEFERVWPKYVESMSKAMAVAPRPAKRHRTHF